VTTLLVHLAAACSAPAEPPAASRERAASPGAAASPADPVEDGALILAFGDSLYAGYGVDQDESFPAQLQALLRRQGIAATVRNAGVSGDTTAAGRQRLAYALDGLPRAPDLVVLGLGGNDMLRGIGADQTEANLEAMLDELDRRGIPVVLTGIVAAPNLGADYAAAFNPIFARLAKAHDAALYPFFLDGVITDRTLMQADGIHPNAKGLARITGRIAPIVAQKLGAAAAD